MFQSDPIGSQIKCVREDNKMKRDEEDRIFVNWKNSYVHKDGCVSKNNRVLEDRLTIISRNFRWKWFAKAGDSYASRSFHLR